MPRLNIAISFLQYPGIYQPFKEAVADLFGDAAVSFHTCLSHCQPQQTSRGCAIDCFLKFGAVVFGLGHGIGDFDAVEQTTCINALVVLVVLAVGAINVTHSSSPFSLQKRVHLFGLFGCVIIQIIMVVFLRVSYTPATAGADYS